MGRLEKSNMSTIGENIGPLSPAATYGDLLNLNNNGQGLINTPVQVQDGYGNLTNIFMSLVATNFDRRVSELQLDGIALTASATTLNNISFAVDAPYIVASSYPSLPNSVILAAGSGISLTAGGGNYTIAASGESAGLNSLTTTGIVVRTGTASYNTASITSNNGTITVTNGSAVSGNPDLAVVPSTTVQNVNVLSNGVQTSTRSSLNFIPSTGISISVVDNSGSGQTDITFSSSGSGGTVTSVSGTTNRITVTNGTTTPVIDISASYVGQSSITTLGTISTGTWQGTAVTVPYGGTGDTSFTAYSVLCGGTTSTGAFQNVSGVGTSGQVLTSNGASTLPTWQTFTAGTVTSVSGTSGQIDVATGTTTPVISISASYVGQTSITTLGTIGTGTWQGTAVTVPYGGTGDTSFTAYSVLCGGTTSTGALQNVSGVGTSGYVLTSNGASSLPTWQAAGSGTVTSVSGTANRITSTGGTTPVIDISAAYVGQTSITTLGTITTGTWHGTVIGVVYGGTGLTSLTAHGILIGEGTSNVTPIVLSAGQILIGTTSSDPSAAFLSGTANEIDVVSSTGSIVLSLPNVVVVNTSIQAGNLQLAGNTLSSVNINGNIVLSVDGTAAIQINNGSSVTPLQFYNSAGTRYVAFQAGTLSANTTWTLPTTDSTGTQALVSNGSGTLSWSSFATGTVTSVSGTSGQIDVATGTTTPVISISASYVGQSSITTLGTITTGTWHGTAVGVIYGGTGDTSFTAYSVLCGGTTSTAALQNVSGVGTSGQVLTSNGASALPTWQAGGSGTVTSVTGVTNRITVANSTTTPLIDISAAYVGQTSIITLGTVTTGTWNASVIALAYGGTNANLTASNGGIFYSTASAGAILAGTATANQILLSGSSTTPAWSTATYPATTTINQLLYSSSANTIAGLATANNGILVTSSGGVPSISSILPTAVQSNITQLGTITSGAWNGSSITVPYGGTGNTTFTAYSLITAGTTSTGAFQNVSGVS